MSRLKSCSLYTSVSSVQYIQVQLEHLILANHIEVGTRPVIFFFLGSMAARNIIRFVNRVNVSFSVSDTRAAGAS